MFGPLGLPELLFILALALLIFGPRKLPEVGRTLGKGLAEFRKASTELRRSINAEMLAEELRESDPRRILREEAAKLTASPVDEGGAAAGSPGAAPAVAREAPAGAVARGEAEPAEVASEPEERGTLEVPAPQPSDASSRR